MARESIETELEALLSCILNAFYILYLADDPTLTKPSVQDLVAVKIPISRLLLQHVYEIQLSSGWLRYMTACGNAAGTG